MLAGILLNLPQPQRPAIKGKPKKQRFKHDSLITYRFDLSITADHTPDIDDDLMLGLSLLDFS